MNITLYHCPRACSRVTMNALEEAGFDFADEVVNIFKGEQKSPEYLAVHPGGKVPALKVDDAVITENASILLFLHDAAPEAKLLPDADNPVAKAQQRSDLIWCSGTVHPMVRQVRMPIRFTDGDPSGVKEKGREYLDGVASQVDARVAGERWWYGHAWSIVDVYLFWLFSTAATGGFDLEPYTNLRNLMQRVTGRESFRRASAREREAEERAGLDFPAERHA